MKHIKTLKIDIDKKNFEVIPSVQYDSNTRFLHIQLLNNSVPCDITGCSVILSGVKEDGTSIFNSCDVINPEIAFIQAEITEQMNVIPGLIDCEIKIYDGEGVLTSKKFTIKVTASQTSRSVVSSNEFKALTDALNKVQAIDNKAEKAEVEKLSSQLDTCAKKDDVARISSGTPLFVDSESAMTDITKNYVNTTDGYLYTYNGTTFVKSNVKYQEMGLSDGQVTPNKTSFYYRESSNLYDISTLNKNYCNNVETIEGGVLVTKSLGANVPFHLNVNSLNNVGKGVQTLKAGTYYLKYKAKGTSGETGIGSGIYPPRLYGSDAIRHNFTKVSGVNSTDFTEWVWSITLESDVSNYGFLIQNGSFAEVYTIKDIMITSDVNNEYEDYETYYSEKNIKNKKYDNYENSILENKKAIKNIEDKMLTIENPKVLHCGFIGDSLTEGDYGSLDGSINKKDLNYPYYFKQATGWTGTNFGKCGWTTKDVWERIVSTMQLFNSYKIFIIMLGTNGGLTDTLEADCIGDDYNNYANTQTGSYCKIVEHIMKNCPTAQIFLCTPPYNNKTGKKEYIIETGNVVKKIAKKYNIQVIDVYSELGVNSLNENVFLPIDKLHFGQYGYQKLGVFLASKIKSNLSYYDL